MTLENLNASGGGEISAPGLSQEQMRANLDGLMGKIEEKYQDFNSQKFATGNKIELMKREAIKEVFNIMSEAGIDLEDPEDVKLFLDSLRQRSPELSQITENSLETLFQENDISQNPVNANENIPQNI